MLNSFSVGTVPRLKTVPALKGLSISTLCQFDILLPLFYLLIPIYIIQLLEWTIHEVKTLPQEKFTREELSRHLKQFTKLKNIKFSPYMKVMRTVMSGMEV